MTSTGTYWDVSSMRLGNKPTKSTQVKQGLIQVKRKKQLRKKLAGINFHEKFARKRCPNTLNIKLFTKTIKIASKIAFFQMNRGPPISVIQ